MRRASTAVLFLVGVCLGALVAALLSRDFAWRGIPPMWATRFGSGAPLRAGAAFAGGFMLLVGRGSPVAERAAKG